MNKKKIVTYLLLAGIISTFCNGITPSANVNEYATEQELVKILDKYKDYKVVLEDGMVLNIGDIQDIAEDEGKWTISNKEIIDIVDGEIVSKSIGSTFVTQEIDDTVYVMEVCIAPEEVSTYSTMAKYRTVDRNYYKVFLDPGHGGVDSGAVANGLYEDELNLIISEKIKDILESRGIEVEMSRYDDTYLSLYERTLMSNNYGSDLFVSIHQNSFTNEIAQGIETFYYQGREDSKKLATNIQNELIKNTNAVNRGIKYENFAVIRTSNMPSNLVECGFISNKLEAEKLGTAEYQDKLAKSISNGIIEYLEKNIGIEGALKPEDSNNESVKPEVKPENSQELIEGTVNANPYLNVRSSATIGNNIIGSIADNSKIKIISTSGDWYKINFNGKEGYVHKDYVTINKTSNTNTNTNQSTQKPTETVTKGTVNTGGVVLNIRSSATLGNNIIGSFSDKSTVDIVGTEGSWYKIKYNNGYAYVSADYVVESQVSTNSNTTTNSNANSNTNNNNATKPTETTVKGTVNTGGTTLNVRSSATLGNNIVGSLKDKTTVDIIGTEGSWYKIKYNNGYAYVSADYVVKSQVSNVQSEQVTSGTKKGTVNVPSNLTLNVRENAGTSYKILGGLKNNTTIDIVSESNGWYKIKYNNGYGFVSKEFVTTSNSREVTSSTVGTVMSSNLRVREENNYSANVIKTLSLGETVEVISKGTEWDKIQFDGNIGYITSGYIDYNVNNII